MEGFTDSSALDTIKYPFQICGIFKTPIRALSDTLILKAEGNE